MYIYCITNLINNKQYIGQTINDVERRWYEHKKSSARSAIALAIVKYGVDNFKFEILQKCDSLEEMNKIESTTISTLNTLSPNGYNLNNGGNNKTLSETTKAKIRESWIDPGRRQKARDLFLGDKNPMFGKIRPSGDKHPSFGKPGHNLGKKLSVESRKKISESKLGKPGLCGTKNPMFGKTYDQNPRSTAVVQLDLMGNTLQEFSSIKLASETTGASFIHIGRVCRGQRKTSGGFKWKYLKDLPVAP